MSDKMREVPPITDETYKALMVALGMPNNRSLLSALQQIANHATQRAAWQAAQSEQSADLERLRKDAERLRDALRYYGAHSNACDMSRFVNPAGCTCGYDAAIAKEPPCQA